VDVNILNIPTNSTGMCSLPFF